MYKGEVGFLRNKISILLFFIALFLPVQGGAESYSPCKNIKFDREISLSDTEKRLLCGDPKQKAWKVIPLAQAQGFATSFLESRGHLTPEFKIKNGKLLIKVGQKHQVKQTLVAPQDLIESNDLNDEIWRLYRKTTLTPKTLSSMEASATGLAREKSYACAKFKSTAYAEKGLVILEGEELDRYKFGVVKTERLPGLEPTAFDRFYPFHPEQPFNSNKLKLAEKRLERTGVVDGSYFIENCDKEVNELTLEHDLLAGPPRVFGFGVGISTEVGPMFRARWGNNRYGPMASQLQAVAKTDLRQQSLILGADLYRWPKRPRLSLDSKLELTREKQVDYEETNASLSSHIKRTYDSWERLWTFSGGPTLLSGSFTTDTSEDEGGSFSGVAFEGRFSSMSHAYEIYDFLPEQGSFFRFHFDYRGSDFGFDDKLLMLEAEHTALKRLFPWGRGHAVGGLRFGLFTTAVEDQSALTRLPPSVKFYGGGSDDIRGFAYRQLPDNNGLGALSKALVKLELRKTSFLISSLETFVFFDAAYFGFDSYELSPRMRQSPGLGLRWVSPVGLFQTFFAKGYTTKPYEENGEILFVGLGGEF